MADGGAWPGRPALQGHIAGPAPGPAATPSRSCTRCACGASTWPLQLYLCARCLSLEHAIATIQVTSRDKPLKQWSVESETSWPWHQARTGTLRGVPATSGGYYAPENRHSDGGLADSVDRFTDVIDVIIAYVLQ